MLDILNAILLAFLAGVFVKSVDFIDDELKGKYLIKWPLALIYGGMIGLLISQASFSTIFIATLFAQVFARKIDTHTHVLGFAIALLSLFYLGFPQIDIMLFVFFAFLAFIDEIEMVGKYRFISEYRPFLKIGSLLLIPFGRFDYFLAIMAFDIGYLLFTQAANRFYKPKPA
jgi:hypothetical protein